METQAISEIVPRILEMQARASLQPTSKPSFDESKKRKWLDKWLCLTSHHSPQLKQLETAIYEFCLGYAKSPREGYRLIIYGNYGSGKTHAAKAVCRWASRVAIDLPWQNGEMGPRLPEAKFVHWPTLVKLLYGGQWDAFENLNDIELLAIDDVGAEHDPTKIGEEHLYLLLERRVKQWTIITTNVLCKHWNTKFDRRIASRFLRNTKVVSVENVPDYSSL